MTDRRSFLARLFGGTAAIAAAPAIVKPAPAPAPIAEEVPRFYVPRNPVPAVGGTYAITMSYSINGPVLMDARLKREALERFDRQWAELKGRCLLEGGKV